jgi:hypothetical protein
VRIQGSRPAIVIAGVYLALAIGVVIAGGFRAQDFDAHVGFLERYLEGRWYLKGLTNPPLLYLYSMAFVRLAGRAYAFPFISASFALLNTVSVVLFWRCATRVISARGSLMVTAWIATLPAFVTTTVVFASDALVILPFTLFCYLNLRLLEAEAPAGVLLVASPLTQVWGCLSKYAFIGVAPAAFVVAAVLAFRHRGQPRLAIAAVCCVFLLPTAVNMWVMHRLDANAGHHLTFPHPSGAMTFRSLLWPYTRDAELLAAPLYFDPIESGGQQVRVTPDGLPDPAGRPGYRLLVNNRYSYPALLMLSLNSDIMNVTHRRLAGDNAFTVAGPRRPVNQFFQRASVALGALMAVVGVVVIVAAGVSWLRKGLVVDQTALHFVIGAVLPAATFTGLVISMLPFVGYETYYGGFWLPRFVIAGFLVFGIAVAWAASTVVRRAWLRQALVALVVVKISVQLALYF